MYVQKSLWKRVYKRCNGAPYAMQFYVLFLFIPFNVVFAAISSTCRKPGLISLTFDQGPGPYTGRLLDILSEKNTKATFHVTVDLFRNTTMVDYVRRAHLEGHSIGIFMPESALPGDEADVKLASFFTTLHRACNWITSITGGPPRFLRLGTKRVLPVALRKSIGSLGLTITKAKVDIRDENNKMDSIWGSLGRGLAHSAPANNSFIIRQRDLMPNSVASTDKIIDYLVEKGYKIVSLEECVK